MRGVAYPLVALILFSALAIVPTASALPACRDSATVTLDGSYHIQAAGIRSKIWEESNGRAGLQTASCTSGGQTYAPDTLRAEGVPQDLGILGVCAFTPVLSQCF